MRSFMVLLALVIALFITILMARQQREHASIHRSERARWSAVLEDLQAHRYQIESYEGSVEFAVYPQEQGATYALVTPTDVLPVLQSVYDAFHARSDNLMVHYLSKPVVTLLSVAVIPVAEAPTDAELTTVTGIGDDGELIYEEQDTPSKERNA
jgi:hypothetical protein